MTISTIAAQPLGRRGLIPGDPDVKALTMRRYQRPMLAVWVAVGAWRLASESMGAPSWDTAWA